MMHKLLTTICVLALALPLMGQIRQGIGPRDTEQNVTMPEYPGGLEALMNFISSEISYPPQAEVNNVEGQVVLQFVVTKTGQVGDIEVVKSVSPDLDAEAIRVCKLLPYFKPGTVDGKPANVRYTLPLTFWLDRIVPDFSEEMLQRANNGDMEAQYTVGYCFYKGQRVTLDWLVARHYLGLAAQQGHEKARILLEKTMQYLNNETN